MNLVLELVMLVILVKLDLFGFELLLMVLVELVLITQKRSHFFHFPSKSLSLSSHRPPGDLEEDLSLIANKETSHYLCSHHQGKYYHCHHCQSSLPPFRLSPTMPWMKSTFGKHPAGCLWRIRWETKICVLFLCVF